MGHSKGFFEEWYGYDKDGNMIYTKYPNGTEEWFVFDENGNRIYSKNSRGTKNI